MSLHHLAHPAVIGAMLAPALLMAATGSLLISANARLARVVDRLRLLLASGDGDLSSPERARTVAEHRRRAALVLRACRLLYAALGCFVGTSLALAADALLTDRFGAAATGLALLGTLCLLLASGAMGLEVSLAVRSLDAELDAAEARHRPR
jgi:hypothetical protein